MTHRQSDPYMQLCMFLLQDTDDFVSLRQLVKIELNNLQKTNHQDSRPATSSMERTTCADVVV